MSTQVLCLDERRSERVELRSELVHLRRGDARPELAQCHDLRDARDEALEQASDEADEERGDDREQQRRAEEEVSASHRHREREGRSVWNEHPGVHQKFDTTSLNTRPMDDWSDASYEVARVASAIRCRTFL